MRTEKALLYGRGSSKMKTKSKKKIKEAIRFHKNLLSGLGYNEAEDRNQDELDQLYKDNHEEENDKR